MNKLAIAIQLNDQRVIFGAQWPTMRSLKATARLKLARLKYKAREVALNMATVQNTAAKCSSSLRRDI